ncbi:MAG TPA: S9 family peptidase [Gemmatimonadales bacterium]
MSSIPLRFGSIALLTFAQGLVPASLGAQAPRRTLALEMYLDMETVGNPEISRDGRQILYTRGRIDRVNDARVSETWIMDADGSRNRFLVKGSSAAWSPDGTRIAFLAPGEPSGAQIFVRWMDAEGATTQITHVEQAPGNLRWSPDGAQLAFTMSVPGRPEFSVDVPGRPSGARWTEAPRVVTRASYKADRRGYIDDGWNHIFVVPADGGTPHQLTDGNWNHGNPEWMPDGSEIVFSALRVDNPDDPDQWDESEVYAVHVGSRAIRQLTTRKGPDGRAVPSPDGRLIAYAGIDEHDDTYRDQHIYVMNADGSGSRMISGDFERPFGGLTWATDGSGVYTTVSSEGTRNLYFVSVSGGVRPVTEGNHLLSIASFDRRGRAVGTLSSFHEPGDLVTFDPRRPQQRMQLTHVNDDVLAGVTLGDVEAIWYESVDGFRIQGWIVKPPDFDPGRRYPLMLAIHGGPHSMYTVGFNFGWQEHAANGYVTLYTNPRGSTGYGTEFANAIKHAYPGKDFDDLMRGVDAVIARGYIDESRLYVYGCSGGGILTSWIVGHTNRFAAASANCPVTNWISLVGTSDAYRYHRNFERYFWDDPSEHLRRSPIMYVGHVKTPTMLMTGERDLRTPMPQTEEYYQALQVLGVPTMMVRFNGEWHGTTSRPSNFMRTQLFLRTWFEKWAEPEPEEVATGGR